MSRDADPNDLLANPGESPGDAEDPSRRAFLTAAATVLAAASMGCREDVIASFLQRSVRELSKSEVRDMIARLERGYANKYDVDVKVHDRRAQEGVLFGYGLDLSRCVGCRRCAEACVKENNQTRPPADDAAGPTTQIQWIRVIEVENSHGIDLTKGDPYYNPAEVPRADHTYIPIQCQQCENAPCVKVCPVQATWREPDGIVVIDYDWCIGCRYCVVACPYGARHFNWAEPNLPADEINTNTHLLGNRPRPKGVVEKCTFCIHRVREGRYPACLEACPVGARVFGNLLDPNSTIRQVLETKRTFVLKEELNTQPKFFYFYGA